MSITKTLQFVSALILGLALLDARLAEAAELNTEESKLCKEMVAGNLRFLQEEAQGGMDFALDALNGVYEKSGFGKNGAAMKARNRLLADAAKLKQKIAGLELEIRENPGDGKSPGTFVAQLARQQAVDFEVYSWYRSVRELYSVAVSAIGKEDARTNGFFEKVIFAHEDTQATISLAIQKLGMKFPGM